jgi:hypothetical protein
MLANSFTQSNSYVHYNINVTGDQPRTVDVFKGNKIGNYEDLYKSIMMVFSGREIPYTDKNAKITDIIIHDNRVITL